MQRKELEDIKQKMKIRGRRQCLQEWRRKILVNSGSGI